MSVSATAILLKIMTASEMLVAGFFFSGEDNHDNPSALKPLLFFRVYFHHFAPPILEPERLSVLSYIVIVIK